MGKTASLYWFGPQTLNSQQAYHILPPQVSFRVSDASIVEIHECIMIWLHCPLTIKTDNDRTNNG